MVFVRRRPVGLALAALLAIGCERKTDPTAAPDAGPTRDAMTIPSSAPGVVSARPGCQAVVEGGARIAGMQEPGAVSVAVVKGKALIVNTIFHEKSGETETASASRVFLSATTGAIESKPEPITEAHNDKEGEPPCPACARLDWAVATPFGDALSTLSLGASRFGAQGCAGGTVMVKGTGAAKAIAVDQCHFSSALAGAAHGDVVIAVTDGIVEPTKGNVPAVEAVVFAAGKAKPLRLESFPVPGTAVIERPKVDALAAAATAAVTAAAYRVTRGAVQELHVVKLAPDGTRIGKVEVIERGVVGTPAIAFEGDTLHIIWASRATDKDPYTLHWTKWPAGGTPQAHQKLGTGVASAYSPALAIEGGRFLLAWTEGEKTGLVKAGSSMSGLTGALALAGVVSTAGVDAKSPTVALDGRALFVVWQEVADKTTELHASPLRCQE
jgi:hypothetical protein